LRVGQTRPKNTSLLGARGRLCPTPVTRRACVALGSPPFISGAPASSRQVLRRQATRGSRPQ
jgi:hypothetical protein